MTKKPNKRDPKEIVSVRLDPANVVAVERDAERRDRSVSWIVNWIVTEHFARLLSKRSK
jgi:hypothetical protein